MKWTHPALAATLASALVLSACTGDDTEPEATTAAGTTTADDAAATTTPDDGEAATATGGPLADDAATTTNPADPAVVTAAPDGEAVVSVDEAEQIAYSLLRHAHFSQVAGGAKIAERQQAAFEGAELEAAEGVTRLRRVEITSPVSYTFEEPNVLAISREDGEQPWTILVQSVPEDESSLPELHEIRSEDDGATWHLSWSAPMLPGTSIGEFDRRSEGTPLLRDGRGDLEQDPREVVDAFLEYVAYPLESDLEEIKTYGYGPAVREQLRNQAAAVDVQAAFTNTHEVREDTLRSYQMADGSALTLVVVDRDSVFDVRSGMELTPPESFTAFVNDRSITERAQVDSLLFFAIHVPEGDGVPEVVAAREQVVGASGE